MADLPDLLALRPLDAVTYDAPQPSVAAEGRDVLFSGQLLAQSIMASAAAGAGDKTVRSIHTVFARAGTYTAPLTLTVDRMHAGRTWASDAVSASQGERLLARSIVLMHSDEPDFVRHGPPPPVGVPSPDELAPGTGTVFPGAQWRPVPGRLLLGATLATLAWHRYDGAVTDAAAHQAVLAWATCGGVISAAVDDHRDTVDLREAHRTISSGVIAHTVHYTEAFDVGSWLLVATTGDAASRGRVLGGGQVFDEQGRLVAAFEQDSMLKRTDRLLDAGSGL